MQLNEPDAIVVVAMRPDGSFAESRRKLFDRSSFYLFSNSLWRAARLKLRRITFPL